MQIFSPSPTPEGPAAHKRAKPPRTEECPGPADAATTDSWSNSGCGKFFMTQSLYLHCILFLYRSRQFLKTLKVIETLSKQNFCLIFNKHKENSEPTCSYQSSCR